MRIAEMFLIKYFNLHFKVSHFYFKIYLFIYFINGNVLLASSPICGVTHQLHMASLLIFLIVLHEIRPLLSPLTTERK